jgi:hypothetical protein
MRDKRIDKVIRVFRARYPGTKAFVGTCPCPDEPYLRWWVYLLNVPDREVRTAEEFAFDLADSLYPRGSPSFLVEVVGRRRTPSMLRTIREEEARLAPRRRRHRARKRSSRRVSSTTRMATGR